MRLRGLSLLLGVCGAVVAFLGWQALVGHFPPDPAGASMAVRLGQGAAALLPGAGVLALMVLGQMALRFGAGIVDPMAGRETRWLLVNQRVISNTVEQFAIFVPAMLALSAGVTAARMGEVTALGVVFALARLVFWIGYLIAPMGRAPGMAGTLVATLSALVAAAWFWVH